MALSWFVSCCADCDGPSSRRTMVIVEVIAWSPRAWMFSNVRQSGKGRLSPGRALVGTPVHPSATMLLQMRCGIAHLPGGEVQDIGGCEALLAGAHLAQDGA